MSRKHKGGCDCIFTTTGSPCNARHESGYVCSRKTGHTGEHVACTSDDHGLCRWPAELAARWCPLCGTQHAVAKGQPAPWPHITRNQIEALPQLVDACHLVVEMITSPKFTNWIQAHCTDDAQWAMTSALGQRLEVCQAALAKSEGKQS